MSSQKQRSRGRCVRAGLLVGVLAAALALAGISAGSVTAAPTCPEPVKVDGEGSVLQKTAQAGWTGVYSTFCSGTPASVEYLPAPELAALESWGAFGGTTQLHTRQFIASDEAPDAAEITNMRNAAGGTPTVHTVVIPVAQAAIAIIVHPPSGCTITHIKQSQLEEVFRGILVEWSKLSGASGCGTAKITRVVRQDSSGATYQLKHLLFLNHGGSLPCLTGPVTWENLQSFADNGVWPESCTGTTLSPLVRPVGSGAGEEANKVKALAGSIGYVDEATAHNGLEVGTLETLEVSNNTAQTTFAPPVNPANANEANCTGVKYPVPSAAQNPSTSEDVDWSGVYGSGLAGSGYPICTLTWDVAFRDYSNAGFSGFGAAVKDYFLHEALEPGLGGGQVELESNFYAPLPGGSPPVNVLAAAKNAASLITN